MLNGPAAGSHLWCSAHLVCGTFNAGLLLARGLFPRREIRTFISRGVIILHWSFEDNDDHGARIHRYRN